MAAWHADMLELMGLCGALRPSIHGRSGAACASAQDRKLPETRETDTKKLQPGVQPAIAPTQKILPAKIFFFLSHVAILSTLPLRPCRQVDVAKIAEACFLRCHYGTSKQSRARRKSGWYCFSGMVKSSLLLDGFYRSALS